MAEKDTKLTSDGIQYTGSDETFTYSFADLDDDFDTNGLNVGTATTSMTIDGLSLGPDEQMLRKKYPALQDAWDHYNNIKHMCETKEMEDEN